ncbi:precorrin-6y C5,15-methyltransferase (decarboxylating), CbiE subunit [Lentilactobacillus kisonensis DSM 19906 = JCM 15041]|uniref:Precorrin-6y C5,15-methyltransferase (Decarboxylating), CbiE subunit n=3 Tax=Lentilactobacillus kisonensis TaxID=481722 RepID=H1LK52_9LACO|nr:precorrin-6y C5,15-methyltransferase (decarboxylating), CbiE subunit [Lentilactobacillus kisonensis F0435]KRL21636.1 precorrin-6y C5,15-methyltransferase (decarboxylating), CbiE subunit [Lentilactobacillus kisonensis DSM 19906 = JCM 15041]
MEMITVVGIGPGKKSLMLSGTQEIIDKAEIVIGSERQLSLFKVVPAKKVVFTRLAVLKKIICENFEKPIALLASGDPLLYGIGNWVLANFDPKMVKIVPGISSIQYMFHQIGLSMNDCYLTSSHGRVPDFDFLLRHKTVGMVTDAVIGPIQIADAIKQRNLHRTIYVGEMLSYPNERVSRFNEETVENRKYDMNVVIITNEG